MRILAGDEFLALVPRVTWDFGDLLRLHRAVEDKGRAQEALGGMVCRAGCHHCCRRIGTLLPLEYAFLVQEDLPGDPGGGALRSDLHPGESLCGLLDGDGLCGAYARRPVICRTHGFLLLSDDGLDHCPWNFQELEEVDEDLPFRLGSLHETLLRVNLAFLRRSWPDTWRELAEVRVRFQESAESG